MLSSYVGRDGFDAWQSAKYYVEKNGHDKQIAKSFDGMVENDARQTIMEVRRTTPGKVHNAVERNIHDARETATKITCKMSSYPHYTRQYQPYLRVLG